MSKSCLAFIAAYKSQYVNCFTCKFWDVEELTCLNPEEIRKRKKAREFEGIDKMMKSNKAIKGPL